jgi:hypothetical protein
VAYFRQDLILPFAPLFEQQQSGAVYIPLLHAAEDQGNHLDYLG